MQATSRNNARKYGCVTEVSANWRDHTKVERLAGVNAFVGSQFVPNKLSVVHQTLMRYRDALWSASRTGSVDHIGKAVWNNLSRRDRPVARFWHTPLLVHA